MTVARANSRVLVAVLACWTGVTLACAAVTRIAFAAGARRLLKVHFLWAFSEPLSEALAIWLRNSETAVGVGACIALILLAGRLVPVGLHGLERLPFWIADVYLSLTMLRACVLAGVLLGAYGSAQLRAFLPDGPVEVLAWGLLITVYISARRGRSGWRELAHGLLTVEVLLAIAGVLEATL